MGKVLESCLSNPVSGLSYLFVKHRTCRFADVHIIGEGAVSELPVVMKSLIAVIAIMK